MVPWKLVQGYFFSSDRLPGQCFFLGCYIIGADHDRYGHAQLCIIIICIIEGLKIGPQDGLKQI